MYAKAKSATFTKTQQAAKAAAHMAPTIKDVCTYTKLPDGSWGLMTQSFSTSLAGQHVKCVTKAGGEHTKKLGKFVQHKKGLGNSLYAVYVALPPDALVIPPQVEEAPPVLKNKPADAVKYDPAIHGDYGNWAEQELAIEQGDGGYMAPAAQITFKLPAVEGLVRCQHCDLILRAGRKCFVTKAICCA